MIRAWGGLMLSVRIESIDDVEAIEAIGVVL